jgi:uncharacterized protein (DUF1697 family)
VTTSYVALLRGVNVGGRGKVSMEDLRRAVSATGAQRVRTYIQSGNVVFDGPDGPGDEVAAGLARHLGSELGSTVTVVLRTADQLGQVVAANPFAAVDLATVHVTFLGQTPDPERLADLETSAGVGDRWSVEGREIYLHCPDGYGRTKLTNTFFERRLKVPATTRNWRTTVTLHQMATAPPVEPG